MKSPETESNFTLIFQEFTCCLIDKFRVEVESHLGQFADVHYFKVTIHNPDSETQKLGLLRVGSVDGGLDRELQLRQALGNYKMVSELLAAVTEDSVYVSASSPVLENKLEENSYFSEAAEEVSKEIEYFNKNSSEKNSELEQKPEYLEEVFYEEDRSCESLGQKLILLSYFPDEAETLADWLTKENSLESSLLLASQVCQFFRYIYQRQWSFIQIFPKFIKMGTPIQFFDLTGAYPVGVQLTSGFLADYCAPEIAYESRCSIGEQMSTYTVGSLLYQTIHHKLPPQGHVGELEIKPIPYIYQILKICLSPIAEERFPLSQLLSLLVETRQSIRSPQMQWKIASYSTVGLSISRLQNEDSYGVRQHCLSNSEPLILGVLADGMGGMAQGEIASKLAAKAIIEALIPADLSHQEKRGEWLISLVQQANESVASNVRDGGTTLSLVMALGRELMIAHVGDSRILLIRNNQICQLSEDHSMVSMLVASGQITYEESLEHPDRNLLTKSLSSKQRLSEGYVQDLSRFGSELSMLLEEDDILILCSDGVWDLVAADELAEIFSNYQTLQLAVDATIEKVLSRGAHDNATILALKYCL